MGDLNIHHKRWLQFSREDSSIGTEMKNYCDFHGMRQLVRKPTRNEYLLDLVLSNIQGISVKVMPYIADHKSLLCRLPFREILENSVVREVWDFNSAEWKELRLALDAFDWGD